MKWTTGFIAALALAGASGVFAAEDWTGYGMLGVRIAVKDIHKSVDFYTTLGMKVGRTYHPGQQELKWSDEAHGSNIVLIQDDTGPMKLTPGTASFMIEVPDVTATAKKLKDSGYPDVGTPKDAKTFMVLMLKDPDGNQIEMLGPSPK